MKINGTTLIELTQDDVVDGKLIIPDEVTHIADNVGRFLDSIDIDAIIAPNVLEVGNNFCFYTKATELNFPKLTTVGNNFCFYTKATELNFPKLTTVGDNFCGYAKATELNFPKLTTAGDNFCCHTKATELNFPKLTTAGSGFCYSAEATESNFPKLTTVGSGFCFYTKATELNFPKLTTAGNNFCFYTKATELNFPKLTTVGSGFCFYTKATELNFPKLTTARNNFCCYANATELTTTKGVYRRVDDSWFRAERTKTRKGITVHYGELLTGTKCYVAEKDGRFAHGSTAREAVNDVEFKILRKNFTAQPISPDDIIDVNTYRLYTGACSFGVRAFLRQHKIADKPYKASEILPKLRALNAYGIEDIAEYYDFGKRAETPA